MKWLILFAWLGSILFAHYRGVVRLPLKRQLLDHSIILAPINAFMVLTSRVPTTPYVPLSRIPELQLLQDNWETIRDEALALQAEIKAPDKHNDIGFNSFFKYGWKRFYLKWYDAKHPSAEELCPKTVELLNRIAKKVPHCDRIVGLISAGRWLTIIAPIPYLRPSLTIRCVAIEAALLPSSPR